MWSDNITDKDGSANRQLRNNCDLRYCGQLRKLRSDSAISAEINIILAEIIYYKFIKHISANIDARIMILPPFESTHWDESNGINYIEIQSLDHVSLPKFVKCLCSCISVNIDVRKMILIPFDGS